MNCQQRASLFLYIWVLVLLVACQQCHCIYSQNTFEFPIDRESNSLNLISGGFGLGKGASITVNITLLKNDRYSEEEIARDGNLVFVLVPYDTWVRWSTTIIIKKVAYNISKMGYK